MSQPASPPGTPPTGRRPGYDRQVQYGRYVGLFFLVAGFVAIAFGWHGTAKNFLLDKQFPYLISGAVGGLALVVLGTGLLLMAQLRDERLKLGQDLGQLGAVVSRSVGAAVGPAGSAQYVAGKSTYHRPECRLVEGKAQVDLVSIEVARLGGLTPCRVCNPPGTGDGAAEAAPSEGGDAQPPATESTETAEAKPRTRRKSTAKTASRR